MPRYFFDLLCREMDIPDIKGVVLRDADQAYDAAKATALDLMQANAASKIQWLACHFAVRDDSGDVVLEFPFSETVEAPPKTN